MEDKSKAYDFNPDDIAPKEVQDQLMDLLRWRDDVMRDIERQLEMIPGLTNLIEELTLAINECEPPAQEAALQRLNISQF
jgi:beta-phosphoglucomutase-like phosphatase (HAD superfamily)